MNMKQTKKSKLNKLPKFSSLLEEAEFWDTHSLTDYFDFSKPLNMRFELTGIEKEETLTFRLQKKLKNQIEKIAESFGLSVSSLMRMWAIEKLAASV